MNADELIVGGLPHVILPQMNIHNNNQCDDDDDDYYCDGDDDYHCDDDDLNDDSIAAQISEKHRTTMSLV